MSQIGVFQNNAPVGSGIALLKGDNVDLVGPDINDTVKILGGAGIVVTGDTANNELTIDSTVAASLFRPNDGNDASPVLNILNILGTINQIETIGIPVGGPYTGIGIRLTDPVVVNNLTANATVQGATVRSTGAMIAGNSLTVTTGNLVVTDGTLTVTSGAPVTFQLNGVMNSNNLIETSSYFRSTNTNQGFVSAADGTHNAFQTTLGNIITTNGRITGANLTITSCNVEGGVVQTDNTGKLSTSVGADGQILISGGLFGPTWANITSPDASVVITNGANSIRLSSGATIATTYPTDGLVATPIGKVLQIRGSGNITTSAVLGNRVQIDLNNNITLSGFINATGNIESANGNILAPNGAVAALNGFSAFTGDITTNSGDIATTTGTVSGAHLVATTDLTVPNATGIPRVLLQNNANPGLIVPTNGTNGQVLMADAATGVAFGNLTAGAGIGLAYNSGTRTTTITNTGAGGVKAAFFSRMIFDQTNMPTGGLPFPINGTWLLKTYDPTNSFDCTINPATFTAASTGLYRFSLQFACQVPTTFTGALCFTSSIIASPPSRMYTVQGLNVSPGNLLRHQLTFQQSNDIYLTATQTVYFTIACEENSTVSHQYVLLAAQTFITGFQIS